MKQALWSVAIVLLIAAPLAAQDALSIDSEGRIWVTIHGTEPLLLETVVVPVGTINAYGGTIDPVGGGWLICDGRALSSTDYPKLFAVIGTAFGDGSLDVNGNPTNDPSLDFNLPDMRGRFARGLDTTGQSRDPDSASRTNIQGDPQDGIGGIQEDALQRFFLGAPMHTDKTFAAYGTGTPNLNPANSGYITPTLYRLQNYPQFDPNEIAIQPQDDGTGNPPRLSSETRPDNVAVNYIIKHGEAN